MAAAEGTATLSGTTTTAVTTTNDGAIGLVAAGGGTINITGPTTITTGSTSATTGASAYGLYANNGGIIQTSGTPTVNVTTYGAGAIGVYASGTSTSSPTTPSTITLGGVTTIMTSGGVATIMVGDTQVFVAAAGVQADGGGQVTLSGGSTETPNTVTTTGDGAIGLYALSGGTIDVNGPTAVTTSGTTSTTATGGLVAYGVKANGFGSTVNLGAATTVTTNGSGAAGLDAYGLYANNGGTIDTTGTPSVTVTTYGTDANGVYASGTSSSTPATPSTISISGASITTNGSTATGVQADRGGQVTVDGGSVTTNGGSSIGVQANGVSTGGASSEVTLTGAMTVTTNATGAAGLDAYGLYANGGGTIDGSGATSVTVTTYGTDANGVYASGTSSSTPATPSTISITGASITTNGSTATGVLADRGGQVTLSGGSVTTNGGSSIGVQANGVSTGGASSEVTLTGAMTVTTNATGAAGLDAYGLYANGGGTIDGSGATSVTVTTYGTDANGVYASGTSSSTPATPSTISITGASITTNGSTATGVLADLGGQVTVDGGSVTTNGGSSIGVQANGVSTGGASSEVTLTGAMTVTTNATGAAGLDAYGLYANGGGTIDGSGATSVTVTTYGTDANGVYASGDVLVHAVDDHHRGRRHDCNQRRDRGGRRGVRRRARDAGRRHGDDVGRNLAGDRCERGELASHPQRREPAHRQNDHRRVDRTQRPRRRGHHRDRADLDLDRFDHRLDRAQRLWRQRRRLRLRSQSGRNYDSATTGSGIPVVVVTNGGTTSTTAFKLATPVTAGGFQYTLAENPSNDDWYLMSSPVPSPENAITAASIQNSVNSLAQAQFNNMVTTRLLGSLLLGANEQVSGCDCGGGFAGVGSFSLGSHGRWALTDNLTLLAGASWDSFYQDGTNVSASPIVAASLRYDPSNWGTSRPFLEFGAAVSPYISASYTRYYNNGFLPAEGVGSAIDRGLAIFGRAGWVARLTPIDEGAVFVDLVRGWQEQGGYTEVSTAVNPFPATVSNGVSREDVVRVGAQYTHLLFGNLEANVNGARGPWLRQQLRVASIRPQFRIDRPVSDPQLHLGRVWRPVGLPLLAQSGGRRVRDRHAGRRSRQDAPCGPRRALRVLRPPAIFRQGRSAAANPGPARFRPTG